MSELSYSDIEKLIKKDAPGIYQYYLSEVKPRGIHRSRFTLPFYMAKDLFMVFLMKLTPLRRLFYTAALVLFLYSMWVNHWNLAFLSFLMFNVLLAFELADKLTAKDELDTARRIQMNLMPTLPARINDFETVCHAETAKDVGGDYCNFIQAANGHKDFIMIGDISGKGMSAALHMVQMHTIVNHLSKEVNDSGELLKGLNKEAVGILGKEGFFTASVLTLSETPVVNIRRAGHLPVIHYSVAENTVKEIKPAGIGLGLAANGIFDRTLESLDIEVGSGDIILLYTDGISEAMSINKEMFGSQRLIEIISKNSHKSLTEIKNRIIHAVKTFSENDTFEDDLTMILLRYLPEDGSKKG
ncbi:MAG: serine/threonine-protein phosphatase [Ignavibacteriaceae bacterium]|nr:serine/threonine-protein phosphatase [Ignavibacteriaceae bacterium]